MTCQKCTHPVHCKGLCKNHYELDRRSRKSAPRCTIEGCGGARIAKGLCSKHYTRLQVHGSTDVTKKAANGSLMKWIGAHTSHVGDDCLIWPFSRDRKSGYARFGGRGGFASRVMCIAAHGNPPSDIHEAAHSCGKGHMGCANPLHLSWKTPAQNTQDKFAHGTVVRGSDHHSAILDESRVRAIREWVISGGTQARIAANFGVSKSLVNRVVLRKSWAWVS